MKNNMILKLRFKLVAISMVVTLAVLSLIVGGINYINYRKVSEDADNAINYLTMHYGKEEAKPEFEPPKPGLKPGFGVLTDRVSPEIRFESRYFVVVFDDDGKIITNDTEKVFAVSRSESAKYAKKMYAKNLKTGFYKTYRFAKFKYEGKNALIFLDCFKSLSNVHFFLFASVLVSLCGWIFVFAIVAVSSKKIVEPVAKSYERQKRFITDAGHEIKTPLAIIQADADVLSMTLAENEWLCDIKLQLGRLTKLTNDLIRLSKLDEGRNELQFTDFSISEIALETVNSFSALATVSEMKIEMHIEPNITVSGDAGSVQELLNILLDNAIKYGKVGTVIGFELQKKAGHVLIEVSNAAEDMNGENLANLFERFYRTDLSRNSKTGGYGIGLSIAKVIVEAHGGQISAEYALGILKIKVRM